MPDNHGMPDNTTGVWLDDMPSGYLLYGRWNIETEIGRGGMGKVYKATDTNLEDSIVALKGRISHTVSDADTFKREAIQARKLGHPNIARIYDFHEFGNVAVISMEWVPGETLDTIIRSSSRTTDAFRITILSQLAKAIDYLRQRGVLHSDIKPSNVVVAPSTAREPKPIAKLVDFGVAKSLSRASLDPQRGGSVHYAPPELFHQGVVDHRADLYAFAVMAYELFNGGLPFIKKRGKEDCALSIKDYSIDFNQVLSKGFSFEPNDRFDNASEFVRELAKTIGQDVEAGTDDFIVPDQFLPSNSLGNNTTQLQSMNYLMGRCVFCDHTFDKYDMQASRHHCMRGCPPAIEVAFAPHYELFPTIFPEPRVSRGFSPPHPAVRPALDGFLVSSMQDAQLEANQPSPSLPYPESIISVDHLRCGHPTLHDLGDLSHAFGFDGRVTVCDMSTYHWSGTLKDPKSWAVVRCAVDSGIRHLGVWTAGNAGFSLANIVNAVNCGLKYKDRINVYCYSFPNELTPQLKSFLTTFGARVVEFKKPPKGVAYSPATIRKMLNAELKLSISGDEFWDVTDGWDGVGVYMYRLLARQLCIHRRPEYIVVPVGTGSLLFGMHLGLADCVNGGLIKTGACKLVGAVPFGKSIIENFRGFGIGIPHIGAKKGTRPPLAPKLHTIYTPLLLVLHSALSSSLGTTLIQVSKENQDAAKMVLDLNGTLKITSEPSALVAFGALLVLANIDKETGVSTRTANRAGTNPELMAHFNNADIVVVNSGAGIFS